VGALGRRGEGLCAGLSQWLTVGADWVRCLPTALRARAAADLDRVLAEPLISLAPAIAEGAFMSDLGDKLEVKGSFSNDIKFRAAAGLHRRPKHADRNKTAASSILC